MLCPNRTSSCFSSPKDRVEQEGYQNSGSFGENGWGDFAGGNPLPFAREAIVAKHGHALPYRIAMTASRASCQHHRRALQHFCDTAPDGEASGTARATDHLVRRYRSSCYLLALKHPSRPWCLDCFRPIPHGFSHRAHRRSRTLSCAPGRYLDVDYCTASPCNARSRPSRSVSCVTRRPTNILTTRRMIKLATAS